MDATLMKGILLKGWNMFILKVENIIKRKIKKVIHPQDKEGGKIK